MINKYLALVKNGWQFAWAVMVGYNIQSITLANTYGKLANTRDYPIIPYNPTIPPSSYNIKQQ